MADTKLDPTRPDWPPDSRPAAPPAPLDGPDALSSESLLRGRRCVEIRHHGVLYRLQATRQGKLILTK